MCSSVVSSINKKACLLACLLEISTKFTQPLILETYSKPLYGPVVEAPTTTSRNFEIPPTQFYTHTRVVPLVAAGVRVVAGGAASAAVADGARDGRVVDVVVLVILNVTRLIALKE